MGCCSEPVTITLTGNQTGISAASAPVLRCENSSLLTIHGLGAGYSGQRLIVVSVGSGQVDIANESSTEAIQANRILNGVTGTISLSAGVGRMLLEYDATTARWRVIDHEQGAWITPAFSGGDYFGDGAMTWTVDSVDVVTMAYLLRGRTITVNVLLGPSTVGGTPSLILRRQIPGGFTSAQDVRVPAVVRNNSLWVVGSIGVSASGTTLYFQNDPSGLVNWTTGTNQVYMQASITFAVQ